MRVSSRDHKVYCEDLYEIAETQDSKRFSDDVQACVEELSLLAKAFGYKLVKEGADNEND